MACLYRQRVSSPLQELLDLRERHSERLAKLAEAHEQELAAAANDAAAAVSRHLAFIDRLLEDKQQLNKQLAEQQAAARVSGRGVPSVFAQLA